MTTIKPYLQFNGNCLEAFEFYKSVLGGEFGPISRYKDMPEQEKDALSEEESELIMHMSLNLPEGTILLGSDIVENEEIEHFEGTNFSLYLNVENDEKANNVFEMLENGGYSKSPMNQTFWGSYFGTLTDKFGVNWMIAHDPENITQSQASE